MSALRTLDLNLDVACDFFDLVTLFGNGGTQLALSGATGQMMIRATELDTTPLVTVSTTPSASGSMSFGVALPSPAGSNCATYAQLLELGSPFSLIEGPPSPIVQSATSIAAMAALDTTLRVLGDVTFVSAGSGSWFLWSPADPLTPNGTTIVVNTGAGPVGNWLFAGTVALDLTAASAATLRGYDSAYYDLLVTWTNATTTKLLSGTINVAQTETHTP